MKKIKDKTLLDQVAEIIEDVEAAEKQSDLSGLKKMIGAKNFFRFRVGDYRLGVEIDKGKVVFLRFMHRREIYRFFP